MIVSYDCHNNFIVKATGYSVYLLTNIIPGENFDRSYTLAYSTHS